MIVKNKKCFITIFILLSVCCYCESKRGGGRRGGNTTPRSRYTTHNSNSNNYHTTQSSIGFENYQRSQNNGNIGFENAQNRPPLNNQPHTSNTNPSAPQQPSNYNPQQQPIGFENVQNRVPQNNPPYHQNSNNQGAPPSYQNQHPNYNYGHQQQLPPGGYNHYSNSPQYNPYQPPPNYYTPHYGSPGGMPPPIYQPVQQSSGGSILGYAGTFAGGYLIGRLTSGGFGSNNGGGGGGGGEYTVHHYHHNANDVPKQVSVTANGLVSCPQNQTQGLCVPNTFPFCLSNGTIMCVTHLSYTTPCNTNNSMPCVISVLPCVSNDSSCNNSTGMNGTSNAVYIPCISKVTVTQQTVLNFTSDNGSNQPGSVTNVDYCITAIAESKKLPSAVPSYIDFLKQLVMTTLNMTTNTNNTANSTMVMTNFAQNKTEMTTILPVTNNENKTEITTLPSNV